MPIVYDSLNEEKVVPSLVPQAVTETVSGVVISAPNSRYITHEIAIGAITTLDANDTLTLSIAEADASSNATTLTSSQALPASAILGVELVPGGTYSTGFPKTSLGTSIPVLNSSSVYPSGSVLRIHTLKNKNNQQLTLTAGGGTGDPSVLMSATAKLSGFQITPAT